MAGEGQDGGGQGGNEGEVPGAAGAGGTPELEVGLMDCVASSCGLPRTYWGAHYKPPPPPPTTSTTRPYAIGAAHSLVTPER